MSPSLLEVLLWSALALLAYSYALYPVAVVLASRVAGRRALPAPAAAELPTVAVLVAAFNEERDIAARLENLLGQDYAAGRLHVLVGSDGSTDRTAEIASRFAGPRVTVHDFARNRGKASVLNDLAAAASAEVLLFTDANTVFRRDTVVRLVGALDGRTAAVCGELVLRKPATGSNEDHRYWNVERRLKLAESSLGGLLGANGGVYAIRRECFRPLPPDTICDDFVIAMNVAVRGRGLRYVPAAVAFEEIPGDIAAEFHRRARIGTGNYQALFRHPEYLLRGPLALNFAYFSHKVLRWLTPHLLLVVFCCSVLLASRPAYLVFAAAQVAGAAVALAVFLSRDRLPWPGVLRAAALFGVLNVAFLVGFWRFATGSYRGSWRRTEREQRA